MERPEVGARNTQPASRFSLTYTTTDAVRLRAQIVTSHAIPTPNVMYGGAPMACTSEGDCAARTEHHFEIVNPPIGTQTLSGTFARDVLYVVGIRVDTQADLT